METSSSTKAQSSSQSMPTGTWTSSSSGGPESTLLSSDTTLTSTGLTSTIPNSSSPTPSPLYYTPVGPKVRLRAVIQFTGLELYLGHIEEYDYPIGTSNEQTATVFIYDQGRTNAFFEASTTSPSGWLLSWYSRDPRDSPFLLDDSQSTLDLPQNNTRKPLACTIKTAGSNEVICGDQTPARSFCFTSSQAHLMTYKNSESNPNWVCMYGFWVTSFWLEYIVDQTSSSSSANDQSTSSSSQAPSTVEPSTTAESFTPSSSSSLVITSSYTTPQSTGTSLESQRSTLVSETSTSISTYTSEQPTNSNSQLSSSVVEPTSSVQSSQGDQQMSSSSRPTTSETMPRSSRGNYPTSSLTLPLFTSESVLSETRRPSETVPSSSAIQMSSTKSLQPTSSNTSDESVYIPILETKSSTVTTPSPFVTSQITTSRESLSDISQMSLVLTPTIPDRTSNLISSAPIPASSSVQEQTFASPRSDSTTLSVTNSESLTEFESSDFTTSQASASTSTSQLVSDGTPSEPSQILTSITTFLLSSASILSSSPSSQEISSSTADFNGPSPTALRSASSLVTSTFVNNRSTLAPTSRASSQSTPNLPPATPAMRVIGIEIIIVVTVFGILEPRHLLHRRQGESNWQQNIFLTSKLPVSRLINI